MSFAMLAVFAAMFVGLHEKKSSTSQTFTKLLFSMSQPIRPQLGSDHNYGTAANCFALNNWYKTANEQEAA